jgi:oligoendopeptidase F
MTNLENTQWDLTDIFTNPEEFKTTKQTLLNELKQIEQYKGKVTNSAQNLLEIYELYEKALQKFEKLYAYGMLTYHLDMANQEGIRLFKEVEALSTEIKTATSFITPEITYANEKQIKEYLSTMPELKRYERDILDTLEKKKYILSQQEENLLANYAELFSSPENVFDVLTNAEFKLGTLTNEKGEEVELTDSNYTLYLKSKNESVRKQAFTLMYKKYAEFINTITELYLANVKADVTTAKIRNYHSSLEKAVIHDDATPKVYETLIQTIHNHFSVNHEFMELKKKLLHKPDFHLYDLYVNPFEEENEKISFDQAKEEVLSALSIMGTEYTNQLQQAFAKRWIDVYPNNNKRGGAYSLGVYGIHPYVLTNFVEEKRDISTIAHELGHSMHSYYANQAQTIIDANYTILVAEVASTVNELLLSHAQLQKETDPKKKATILYELLEMIRATFFRQSMFAEFEKIVHEKIEQGEMLSSEDLNHIYYELNQEYFGNQVVIDTEIQYEWARIPHFYSNFYVYKYATGISSAISISTKIIEQGEPFVKRYLEMLKQGCSRKSIDLLKMVDVDLESPETYQLTIDFYQKKIEELKNCLAHIDK